MFNIEEIPAAEKWRGFFLQVRWNADERIKTTLIIADKR
jgi:hypothetical protein